MNGPETSVESRCTECSALLHAGQDRPVCVRCALTHALEPALLVGQEEIARFMVGDYNFELGRGGWASS
jgi:hypothetical protein